MNKGLFGTVFAVVGILLGVLGANGLFEGLRLTEGFRIWVVYAAGVGFAALIALTIALLVRLVSRKTTSYRIARRALDINACQPDHLETISEWASNNFGRYATAPAATRRLFVIDPGMFAVVQDSAGTLRGYFCLIRLSAAGIVALERGDFNAAHIPPGYVRTDRKSRYNALYIGAVYGEGAIVRGFVLGALNDRIKLMRPTKVFARAASADGLRVLRSNKFVPLKASRDADGAVGDLFVRR